MMMMMIMGLHQAMDQFAMVESVHCCEDVLRREVDHVLRKAFDCKVVVSGQKVNS